MAKRLTAETKYRRMLAWLRREFPLTYPVSVRRVSLKHDCGTCGFQSRPWPIFKIEIARNQCAALQRDSLLHEWAHARTWHWAKTLQDDHSPVWGIAYARLYRRFLVWDYGRGTKKI